MPATIDIALAQRQAVQVYPARLHGAACALLETPDTDHRAAHKPFSVAPLVREQDRIGGHWAGSTTGNHRPSRR